MKFKSKFFRVAVEGMTTDGRKIERSWIQEMASTYNRTTYGARIWMEHMRGMFADGPFKAYGDVLALKAEEVEIDGKKKLALFAQIEPTADLIAMNKAKQKIYSSIEVREKFADSGKAYLMGLGVTDSPASLGTDVLEFSAKNPDASPFKSRKENPDNLFSEAVEVDIEFEEVDESQGSIKKLFTQVADLLNKSKDKDVKDDNQFSDIRDAVTALATHGAEQADKFAQLQQEHASTREQLAAFKELKTAHEKLSTDFAELLEKLDKTPSNQFRKRPPATGGDGMVETDC
ncbi:MAG: GPO family capsid scaffolding protein [Halopseudomonas sp.]|uniref:GPO family capsid scaffolding protein n=1 Tax=Halopseudomonas sp. TaxID=2901191 RepID=UPI003003A2C2